MTTAEALVALLAGAGFGAPGTSLVAGLSSHVPAASPATMVVEYGTELPDETHDDGGWALGKPRCQVVVHAQTYADADAQARAECAMLAAVRDATWPGVRLLRIAPVQTPFDMGPDATGRPRVGFNVAVTRADG